MERAQNKTASAKCCDAACGGMPPRDGEDVRQDHGSCTETTEVLQHSSDMQVLVKYADDGEDHHHGITLEIENTATMSLKMSRPRSRIRKVINLSIHPILSAF